MFSSPTQLQEFIASKVAEHWDAYNRAYPLTGLGAVLLQEDRNYKRFLGSFKLSSYINVAMHDKVKIVTHSQKAGTDGAVPSSIDLPADVDSLFVPGQAKSVMQFDRTFWSAFARPLYGGRRGIRLSKSNEKIVDFAVVSAHSKHEFDERTIEIPTDLIVSSDFLPGPERSNKVRGNINTWLASNNLVSDIFRPRTSSDDEKTTNVITHDERISVTDLRNFSKIINILGEEDQSRITVPLDVIAKILKRV